MRSDAIKPYHTHSQIDTLALALTDTLTQITETQIHAYDSYDSYEEDTLVASLPI